MKTTLSCALVLAAGLVGPVLGGSLPDWASLVSIESGKDAFPEAQIVELYRSVKIKVESSGSREITERALAHVREGDGSGYGTRSFTEAHGVKLKSFHAWHRTRGGKLKEISEPVVSQILSGELYNDARGMILIIPAIGPGSLVAHELSYKDELKGPAIDWFRAPEGIPVVLWEVHLELPKRWSAEAFWEDTEGIHPLEPDSEGERSMKWVREHVAPLKADSDPSIPQLFTPTFRIRWAAPGEDGAAMETWEDVCDWYRGFARDVFTDAGDLKGLAREITRGAEGFEDLAAGAARHVQSAIHYIQIYRKDGGWRPHEPKMVEANRYGDCKDMSYLLIALLNSVGVETLPVFTNASILDPIRPKFPSPQFNHCIVAVAKPETPGKETEDFLFFDPTAKWVPWGRLPARLGGKWALVAGREAGALLIRLPEDDASQNRWRDDVEVTIRADRSTLAFVRGTLVGHPAFMYRGWVNDESQNTLGDIWQRRLLERFPGARLTDFEMTRLLELSDTLRYSYTAEYPKVGQSGGSLVFIPLCLTPSRHSVREVLEGDEIVFSYPFVEESSIAIKWPEDWHLSHAPSDTVWRSHAMSFERGLDPLESGLTCRIQRQLLRSRMSVEETKQLRVWEDFVDTSKGEYLTFEVP